VHTTVGDGTSRELLVVQPVEFPQVSTTPQVAL
jgi:hypothetical protein